MRAYPHDEKECAQKMLETFAAVTPEWFTAKLQQRQDLEEMVGQGRTLTWKDMMAHADLEDKII